MADLEKIKERYGHLFGLPADQVRFFDELTPEQVGRVRQYYSAGLVGVRSFVYAVTRDGHLVWNRIRRDPLLEGDMDGQGH